MGNPLEEISALQAKIETLKMAAVSELRGRRSALQDEIKAVDLEMEKLTGKPPRAPRRASPMPPMGSGPASGKRPDLQELKTLLAAAPNKSISLRKDGYDVRNVKILAAANPHLLRMGGKGPWPTVTLLR